MSIDLTPSIFHRTNGDTYYMYDNDQVAELLRRDRGMIAEMCDAMSPCTGYDCADAIRALPDEVKP